MKVLIIIPAYNEAQNIEKTVKDVTKKVGLNAYKTQINTGKEAGQEVMHLHIHILGNL